MQPSIIGLMCACALIIGTFQEGNAQLLARLLQARQQKNANSEALLIVPVEGSVSKADSEAFNRNVQLGDKVNLSGGVTKSESKTQTENGGIDSARTKSVSKGVQIGKLDISGTLTGSKAVTNGAASGGLSQNLNIGKLGIDSSLSKSNLQNKFGIQRTEDGGLDLNLGLLNIDLTKKKQKPATGQTATYAQVDAVGPGANANSISNTNTETKQRGKITSTETYSKTAAMGSVLKGFTSGHAAGIAGGAPSYVETGGRIVRQAPDFFFPGQFGLNQGFNSRRPQRHPQRKPQRQPQPQIFGNQNANAQGIANNKNTLFEQQAGANTNSQNTVNELGKFQGNTGSSISSNLATDGSSGQINSANTAQQNHQTAQGSGNKNAAQSQSLNFDKDSKQATSSNADTSQTKTADSERNEANSAATSNQQTQLGSATNTAQTNTAVFNEGDRKGSQSNANSQSTSQGIGGGANAANTGTKTESTIGANGSINNSASSQASAFSNNGGPASASASSSSGTGPNGSFTNAQGLANTNGAASNAFSQGGIFGNKRGQQPFANGQAGSFGFFGLPKRRRRSDDTLEPRTFDSIYNIFQSLFSDTSNCNNCYTYPANCCRQCCNFPPQPQPYPVPPPRPLLPPPPPPPPPPAVQITSTWFTPWYYQRPSNPCCPTCVPQIGSFPCGRGGQPFPPPPYVYYG